VINPYEAPQTITRLPTRVVPQIDPDLAVLQGAQYCARGGKLLMTAAISQFLYIGLLVWIQQAKQYGPTNLLNLLGWILLYCSWLLLLAGTVVNLWGYARFARYLDHDLLVEIFSDCRRVAAIKITLVLGFICCAYLQISIVALILLAILVGMVIYSFFVHASAMRIWTDHYPNSTAVTVRNVYFVSGIATTVLTIVLTMYFILQAQEPSKILLMGLMLLFALSFAAFADFYGRLTRALKSTESNEKIAASHD
jgi:hypothetical protein